MYASNSCCFALRRSKVRGANIERSFVTGYIIRSCLGTTTTVALRESPGLCANDLAFGISPEVNDHSYKVVDAGIGALVDQESAEGEERNGGETSFETAVDG
jgi:hypothetical protein